MGGVRIGGSATQAAELGTLFAVYNDIWNGSADEANADVWYVPIGDPGGTPGSVGTGNCVKITSATLGVCCTGAAEFYFNAVPSPSRDKVMCLFSDDNTISQYLTVMQPTGSGITTVNSNDSGQPKPDWVGSNLLVFADTTTNVKTVQPDGTNLSTVATVANLHGFAGAPDGSKIAYIATIGGVIQLHVCDPDGTNDSGAIATGLSAGSTPVWTLDSAQITYILSTGAQHLINADGTGDTSILAAPGLVGFYFVGGMASDRLWYTDTTNHPTWRMAYLDLGGGGKTIVSPTRRLSLSTQRGVCIWDDAQGRAFSVYYGASAPGGVESIFSVLPDGSDLRIHFEALEQSWVNPGDNFQNLTFR